MGIFAINPIIVGFIEKAREKEYKILVIQD